MKSLFKIAVASLGLTMLAAVATPASASAARVEIRVEDSYQVQPAYVERRAIYAAPVPVYRHQEVRHWRHQQWREQEWREQEWLRQQWRERERREHYWRQRNEWREHQWRDHYERDHDRHDGHHSRHRHGDGWRD